MDINEARKAVEEAWTTYEIDDLPDGLKDDQIRQHKTAFLRGFEAAVNLITGEGRTTMYALRDATGDLIYGAS